MWRRANTDSRASRRTGRAPRRKETEHARQLAAFVGECVILARRPFLIGAADDDPLTLQAPKAVGEDVRGNARDGLGQVVEAARPVEQRLDDEERPAIADAAKGHVECGERVCCSSLMASIVPRCEA